MDAPGEPLQIEVLACALTAGFWDAPPGEAEVEAFLADVAESPDVLAALAHLAPGPVRDAAAQRTAPDARFGAARATAAFHAAGLDDIEQLRFEAPDRCLTAVVRSGALARIVLDEPGGGDAPLQLDAAAARLRGALGAAPSLDQDSAVLLPLLEHLLTGAVGAFPRPPVAFADVFGEEDVDLLCEAFAGWLVGEPDYREQAVVVAATMLGFKLDQGASEPVDWAPDDVREYLAEYQGWVTDTARVPPRVVGRASTDFLRFLEDEGLGGPAAASVEVAREWLDALPAPPALARSAAGARRKRDKRRSAKAARRRNRH